MWAAWLPPAAADHVSQTQEPEGLVSHDALEPRVLLLEALQTHHVLGSHGLVLGPPALIGRDRDLQVPTASRDVGSFSEEAVDLAEFAVTCSGVCLLPFMKVTSCPHRGHRDSHKWSTLISGDQVKGTGTRGNEMIYTTTEVRFGGQLRRATRR